MTLTEAKAITGGISFPSKLKDTAAASSLHPGVCITGRLLSRSDHNVCHRCFGKKGRFSFPDIQQSLWSKTEIVKALNINRRPRNYDRWVEAWVLLINHYSPERFRHFMVGDIQSFSHYLALRAVCNDTPNTQHWIPSLDWNKFATKYDPPIKNAVVRWTFPRINQKNLVAAERKIQAVVVTSRKYTPQGFFECPATFHPKLHTCKAHGCTKCWTSANIAYKEH